MYEDGTLNFKAIGLKNLLTHFAVITCFATFIWYCFQHYLINSQVTVFIVMVFHKYSNFFITFIKHFLQTGNTTKQIARYAFVYLLYIFSHQYMRTTALCVNKRLLVKLDNSY